ncbi:hypothetical protein LOD99_14147 [Oopsacas minuta]|uniref:Transmembrane protein 222 n=1 Tax=Oopsacas minuta TaxID=111878 RepID=A0AAV7KI53_9METZ|nr:hypothetical protein LOD99_14147 [Oopsacas minuta]
MIESETMGQIDFKRDRFPFCIVWTPIPLLTWLFPFIGHMGICTSAGVIRDFAGPYTVSEDNMAFGRPTRYLQYSPHKARSDWDQAVHNASEEYKKRMHNLCCDNCHSHVAMSLNLMHYDSSTHWNMFILGFSMFFRGKYTGIGGVLKTWLPFIILAVVITVIVLVIAGATSTQIRS